MTNIFVVNHYELPHHITYQGQVSCTNVMPLSAPPLKLGA